MTYLFLVPYSFSFYYTDNGLAELEIISLMLTGYHVTYNSSNAFYFMFIGW